MHSGAIMEIDNARTSADGRVSAALFLDLLKKREQLPAIVGTPDGFRGRAVARDELDPRTYDRDDGEDPVPPFVLLSVEPGSRARTFRITAEVSFDLAADVGKFGAACFPLFGAVEEERKRERERKALDAIMQERFDRVDRAGRIAFHRLRKAASTDEKHELISETARQFDLSEAAVEGSAKRYRKPFLAKVRKRQAARIWRLRNEGLHDREIANHPLVKVSISTVKNVLGKRKRQRR